MCILFVAINQHKDFPVIIAANRDEFFKRDTAPSHFWPEHQDVLAGRDLQAGGTWMGINKQGYLAALTNIRDPHKLDANARTRGELVSQYIKQPKQDYQTQLSSTRQHYNGYNLLFGPWHKLAVYNNHLNSLQYLTDGYYGLSNASLNSPWPKVSRGVNKLKNYCQSNQVVQHQDLFTLLKDKQQAPDHSLPNTGVPLDWERNLSSIFITGETYGTRSSTVLTISHQNQVSWEERSYSNTGDRLSTQSFQFSIN
ncbi:NRDE family protein [Paraglaciecola aestuariivivens]